MYDVELFDAVGSGDLNKVKKLFESGAVANVKDDDGLTPLHEAAQYGHLDIVEYLVEQRGADVNAKSEAGQTPLDLAYENDHVGVTWYLETVNIEISPLETSAWSFDIFRNLRKILKNKSTDVIDRLELILELKRIISTRSKALTKLRNDYDSKLNTNYFQDARPNLAIMYKASTGISKEISSLKKALKEGIKAETTITELTSIVETANKLVTVQDKNDAIFKNLTEIEKEVDNLISWRMAYEEGENKDYLVLAENSLKAIAEMNKFNIKQIKKMQKNVEKEYAAFKTKNAQSRNLSRRGGSKQFNRRPPSRRPPPPSRRPPTPMRTRADLSEDIKKDIKELIERIDNLANELHTLVGDN